MIVDASIGLFALLVLFTLRPSPLETSIDALVRDTILLHATGLSVALSGAFAMQSVATEVMAETGDSLHANIVYELASVWEGAAEMVALMDVSCVTTFLGLTAMRHLSSAVRTLISPPTIARAGPVR